MKIRYIFQILRLWWKWHKNWDDLCTQCGICCYCRKIWPNGEVTVYKEHCRFLDPMTNLCTVYEDRFKKCAECRKVNLWRALFNTTLPYSCPYVQTFRVWLKDGEEDEEY